MAKGRGKIPPDRRAKPEHLERLAKEGMVFKRAYDNGGAFMDKQEFGIDRALEHFDADGFQVFKGDLSRAGLIGIDLDKPDHPLGRRILKELIDSGTYGSRSRTKGYHFFLRAGAWANIINGSPEIKDEDGTVVAELKKNWLTLYRPYKDDMPFVDAADKQVALWRGLVEKANRAKPKKAAVDVSDVQAAIEKWETRVRSLPDGGHNNGFFEILNEVRRSMKGKRDFALYIALQLREIYDKEVSPGDQSFEPDRLQEYFFGVEDARPFQKDVAEAMPNPADDWGPVGPYSGGPGEAPLSEEELARIDDLMAKHPAKKRKSDEDEDDKPRRDYLQESFEHYIEVRHGDLDGIYLIVTKEGKDDVKQVLGWLRQEGKWESRPFTNVKRNTVQRILDHHNDYLVANGKRPISMVGRERVRTIIRKELLNHGGVTEEFLAEFDRPSRSRFLFGSFGMCEVILENPEDEPENFRYQIKTGGKNEAALLLKRDIEGRIASDAEWERDKHKLFKQLYKYCTKFMAEDDPKSPNKNHFLDCLQLLLATGWVGVAQRPVGFCIGDGNNGKSKLFYYLAMALGRRVMDPSLPAITFTDGSGSATSPQRLLEARKRLNGPAICFVPESPKKSVFDEGFLKNFTDANEAVQVGGMYASDISLILECLALISSNSVPVIRDQTKGFHRRLWLFPFLEDFPEEQLSNITMDRIFEPLYPLIRRWIWEGIKRLVEEFNCVLPPQPACFSEYRKEFDAETQSDIKAELDKCFRKVEDTGKDDKHLIDWFYQKRRCRHGFIGGVCANDRGVQVAPHGESYYGIMLAVELIIRAKILRQKSYSDATVRRILKELKFKFKGSTITNIVHTDYLKEMIAETLGEKEVPDFLKAMYRHSKSGNNVPPYNIPFDYQAVEGGTPPPEEPLEQQVEPWGEDNPADF